eukprot:jgi/Botrbrau1/10965/Bobra.0383s0019.1
MEKSAQELQALKLMVGDLNSEIARLQSVIGKMHVSDMNNLRRAYNSLIQHCGALETESRSFAGDIHAFATEVITPEDVSHGLLSVGVVTTGMYALQRVLRLMSPHAPQVPRLIWFFGAAYLGMQFVQGAFKRLHGLVLENRQRKAQLLQDWKVLRERIEIMNALTDWAAASPALLGSPHEPEDVKCGYPGGNRGMQLSTGIKGNGSSPRSRAAAAAAKIQGELRSMDYLT